MRPKKEMPTNANDADTARLIAAEYCLLRYPTFYTAGCPQANSDARFWTVPIVVCHPVRGVLGTVGKIVVDVTASKVAKEPPHDEVLAAGRELARATRHGPTAAAAAAARKRR